MHAGNIPIPTVLDLANMKGVDGRSLSVLGRIATNYYRFGMNLLQDSNCVEVDIIVNNHNHNGTEAVVLEILKKWLHMGGSTCTYQYLMDRLRESELGSLADEIKESLRRGRSS